MPGTRELVVPGLPYIVVYRIQGERATSAGFPQQAEMAGRLLIVRRNPWVAEHGTREVHTPFLEGLLSGEGQLPVIGPDRHTA